MQVRMKDQATAEPLLADLVESVEASGWKLDQVTNYVTKDKMANLSECGLFVFRRPDP